MTRDKELLGLMRETFFRTVLCGMEGVAGIVLDLGSDDESAAPLLAVIGPSTIPMLTISMLQAFPDE